MTGYVRVDTGNNIADGNVISAADLDNEFDGVVAAFNASTGHTHDGTASEGAPITKIGPTQDVTASASLLAPKTTNTVDIGSSSLKFKNLYLAGNASIAGTLGVTGATTLSAALTYGGVTLSNAVTGTGNMVLSSSPTLVTPNLGTPSTLVGTNITGTASGLSIGGTAAVSTTATSTVSSTASAFKVPFLNTTGTATGNFGVLHDTEATFTYNPSTNTLVVGTVSGALSGNATTATTLQTARTINGVSFNGSANITVAASTTNTLTLGSYLTGTSFNGSSAVTAAVDATTTNTASKVVARDASGNFAAGTITAALSGNATTATTLQTARTIGGVSFNGSANIDLPGVNTAGNQNTSGTAAVSTAATVTTSATASAFKVPFANTTLSTTGNYELLQDSEATFTYNPSTNTLAVGTVSGALSGNATTATTLQTARTINGVSFNGSANITVTANTTNTLTRGTYLTGSNFDGSAATTWAVDATTTNTASKVVARDASGNFAAGTITAALSGNATTATTATNATNVTVTTSATSSAFKVPFANTTVSTTGNYGLLQDDAATFTYNPSTNTLTVGTVSGALSGNATTATTLATARTINGTSFNGSANITTASWGTARTLWGQSVDGSANITAPLLPAAGSLAAPAFSTSGDTNTGIYFPAADTIGFVEGGAEVMRIDSSGNVGIGTSSPATRLHVADNTSAGVIQLGGTSTTGYYAQVNQNGNNFQIIANGDQAYRASLGTNNGTGYITFLTANLTTGNTERMRIDAAGNVGIGTSSPVAKLDVVGETLIQGRLQVTAASPELLFSVPAGGLDSRINNDGSGNLIFGTGTNSSTPTERMRLDSSGNLLVGTTIIPNVSAAAEYGFSVSSTEVVISKVTSVNDTVCYIKSNSGATKYAFSFWNGTVNTGNIATTSGGTTAYNTSSDYRLKNTIAPMTGALARVAALKPVTYKWNADGSDGEGFIAHELAEVCPDAVTGEKDAVDSDGNPRYQGIDTSFLVATLTAAIQEQQAIIVSLQDTLTALTARVAALESI
jgi:hypothetical protein